MGNLLTDACDEGLLLGGSTEVWQKLKIHTESRAEGIHFVLNLGHKDMRRNQGHRRDFPHFERLDGGWFDFALTAFSDKKSPLELIAYSFEIRLDACQWGERPSEERAPCFVRYDLNPHDHANATVGARCHVHIGSEDFSMPSPWMSPLEILDLFIHGLKPRNFSMP